MKDELRVTFNELYQQGLQNFPESETKNDLVFFYIVDKAYPMKDRVYQHAIFVLMAHFFAFCDVFEEPVKA